ncbi:MAG TPA: hypothetical protein VNP72_01855, partial [Longimicrobium sp.]|nr:hypothetical protein [Longimicrobium sp.]
MKGIPRLAFALVLASGAASPAAADVCTLASFPMFRGGVHVIATATADTLPAGAGHVEYGPDRSERNAPPRGGIYGQVVRVERLGGEAAGIPAGADRVVLVPWGYDAGCRTTRWHGSAAWIEPGLRGLVWAGLREREQWVDGVPTLDVHNTYQLPYPDTSGYRG